MSYQAVGAGFLAGMLVAAGGSVVVNRQWATRTDCEGEDEVWDVEGLFKDHSRQAEGMVKVEYLMRNPATNKGTAFTLHEREIWHLRGLLPDKVESIQEQAERCMEQLRSLTKPLNRYTFLQRVQSSNQTLFYYLLSRNLMELMPIVYTPTVGEACQRFSHIFRAATGMFFSARDKGHMRAMLDNWPHPAVDVIVVTDGGRILGLGDLGINGMPICAGKLSLYIAGGGFHPSRTLPCMLDVGTDRDETLADPLYLGSRHTRLDGDAYYAVVDEFLAAVMDKWPHCLVQFEDFKTDKAMSVLERHRDKYRVFNDDIQGTGAVIASGLLNAARSQGTKMSDLRILFFGAGSAAVGVANTIVSLIMEEGLPEDEARARIYMLDSQGHITAQRSHLADHKKQFARSDTTKFEGLDILSMVKKIRPNALMGLSGQAAAFTKEIVEAMCENCDAPIIFPLSNPTANSEITAEDAMRWSKGKAIFASGSPYPPFEYEGHMVYPMQGNNMFIFPGVGMGVVLARARRVTDKMFIAAARALALYQTDADVKAGVLFPSVNKVRDVSVIVAAAVMHQARLEGLNEVPVPPKEKLCAHVRTHMYEPRYDESMIPMHLEANL
eukprot:jgi/Mesvir1/15402/Mv06587-RA.1